MSDPPDPQEAPQPADDGWRPSNCLYVVGTLAFLGGTLLSNLGLAQSDGYRVILPLALVWFGLSAAVVAITWRFQGRAARLVNSAALLLMALQAADVALRLPYALGLL